MSRFPAALTYWAATPDGYGGFSFAAPIHISGRWEDKTVNTIAANGDAIISQAIVYVDRDLEINGYLIRGSVSDPDPTLLNGAYRISRIDKTPNIRYSDYLRKVTL